MKDGSTDALARIGLVMSGGGARGAYEAGVLSYLFDELPQRLGRPVHFDIVTGTSVGGIHACYVAAAQDDAGAMARLLDIWRSLSLDRVFAVGPTDLVRVPWRLVGGSVGDLLPVASDTAPARIPGLFATEWLESLVLDRVPWTQIRRNIEAGSLAALAIAATEIATGRSVVFVDNGTEEAPDWGRDAFIVSRAVRIGLQHALASAAIPLLFAAIRIGRTYYCDGGLRLNTPLAPALRLGADRVLVIGLRHRYTPEETDRLARRREANFASTTYLAGKALNALLLDRVEADLDRMHLFNDILESGRRVYGEEFLARINEPIIAQRGRPYRIVRDVFVQPSEDLGATAWETLHEGSSHGLRSWLSRNVARYAARGALGEADLLSYIFFDRSYAERLIELGRHDAAEHADELVEFFSAPVHR